MDSISTAAVDTPRTHGNHYGLRAVGLVQKPLADIADFRKQLGPPGGSPFPPSFLKVADEQTILAVAAVLDAIDRGGLAGVEQTEWTIIAAPRFLGRLHSAEYCHKFASGSAGMRKTSLFFVPHRSLHAVSGTISQALRIKGANFGVGGGIGAVVEGLLTALSLLAENQLPGLWAVFTQFDPEPRPDRQGVNNVPAVCQAIALAFMPVEDDWRGLRLSLVPSAGPIEATANDRVFRELYHFLQNTHAGTTSSGWSCALDWGHELRLTDEQ